MDRRIYVPEHAALNVARAGQKYRPSNGHEGDLFERAYCMHCSQDENGRCPIFGRTLAFKVSDDEYPEEWQYGADGQPTCTAFDAVQHTEGA